MVEDFGFDLRGLCQPPNFDRILLIRELAMPDDLLSATTQIVLAFVSHNSVRAEDLSDLLSSVHQQMLLLLPKKLPVDQSSVLSWKLTIRRDYLVSLENGKHYKVLTRHLKGLGMSIGDYRAKWGLPNDYPSVCAGYSEQRSTLAKLSDLGHSRRKAEQF